MNAGKPFVKWVGGKTQLLKEIRKRYPSKIERYCEPFVGGGAVLFDVLNRFHPKEVLINDINKELINTYVQIKNNFENLLCFLFDLQNEYMSKSREEKKAMFYSKRYAFNQYITSCDDGLLLEKAALFIFLNKTCFNGLYRVNSKGFFNVPFNNAETPLICDEKNITACSELLKNVQIKAGDYSECQDFIKKNTFVYIDPPYRPLTQTSSFTSYNANNFTEKQQIELGIFIDKIACKGANVLASNSDPKNTNEQDTFFEDLYSNFEIERISAVRMINADAKKRGAINELLISNIAPAF